MNKPYVLALLAMKPDPSLTVIAEKESRVLFRCISRPGEDLHTNNEIRHWPGLVLAASEGEARQIGMDWVLEKFPKEDGWVCHMVQIKLIDPEFILEAMKLLPESATKAQDDDARY